MTTSRLGVHLLENTQTGQWQWFIAIMDSGPAVADVNASWKASKTCTATRAELVGNAVWSFDAGLAADKATATDLHESIGALTLSWTCGGEQWTSTTTVGEDTSVGRPMFRFPVTLLGADEVEVAHLDTSAPAAA